MSLYTRSIFDDDHVCVSSTVFLSNEAVILGSGATAWFWLLLPAGGGSRV